jgi:mRNA interferase RelE/StbE
VTARYTIAYAPAATKQVRHLDPPVRRRILAAISPLTDDPRPPGCKALQGQPGYRIRVGDRRVIYHVDDQAVTVLVVRVGPRGSIYR